MKGRVHVVYRRSAIKREPGQKKEDLHNEGKAAGRQWKKHRGCVCMCVCVCVCYCVDIRYLNETRKLLNQPPARL